MGKIYDDASDVHVRATQVYAKTSDAYAYADAANTVKISAVELKDMFEKGIVVVDGTIEYKPVSFKLAAGVGTITYVKTDGTTPTTAVLATLASSEYVAG
jgi:hypothetical protein